MAEQAHYRERYYWRRVRPGAQRIIYLLLTQPGADRISHPRIRRGRWNILLYAGKSPLGLTEAPERAGGGDYICYPGDRAHIFKNAGTGYSGCITVAEQGKKLPDGGVTALSGYKSANRRPSSLRHRAHDYCR